MSTCVRGSFSVRISVNMYGVFVLVSPAMAEECTSEGADAVADVGEIMRCDVLITALP